MSIESLADGRYLLGGLVGVGGMAEVYCARDTRLHRDVAVKLFRPGAADGVSRGSDEARLLAGLHHPGLVRILDMDSAETSADPTYLVMELVEGPDLGVTLTDGPLPGHAARLLGWDVARTLAYIHQRDILHRDIKPSNILTRSIEPDSGVFGYLLTDFGIARFYDAGRRTAVGQTIGTAAYLSPEQARGSEVGTPTDIYSLGLVLLESLTGAQAYPGTSLETAVARLHRPPAIPEELEANWKSLLARMTADRPDDRPTAGAVAAEFSQWKDSEPGVGVLPVSEPAAKRYQLSLPDQVDQESALTTVLATAQPTTQIHHQGLVPPGVAPTAGSRSEAARSPVRSLNGRRRFWMVAIAVLIVGVAAIVGLNLTGQGSVEELPAVPGTTGELLQELYEGVQP